MNGKNHRKATRSYRYDMGSGVTPLYDADTRSRYIRVTLEDPQEPDRPVDLNLTQDEATYLAHRLLSRVEVAQQDDEKSARYAAAVETREAAGAAASKLPAVEELPHEPWSAPQHRVIDLPNVRYIGIDAAKRPVVEERFGKWGDAPRTWAVKRTDGDPTDIVQPVTLLPAEVARRAGMKPSTARRAPAARTVDTSEYVNSHGRMPRGRGGWIFRNADTGDEVNKNGTYREAKYALAGGRWIVLP
jgi:hypothetical protein